MCKVMMDPDLYEKAFKIMDKDDSGSIDFDEFVGFSKTTATMAQMGLNAKRKKALTNSTSCQYEEPSGACLNSRRPGYPYCHEHIIDDELCEAVVGGRIDVVQQLLGEWEILCMNE